VLTPFQAKPTRVNFGRIARGDTAKKQTVTLTRGDGGPIHPEVVRTGDKAIVATLREVEPGERYDLDVEIQPPWPNRRLQSWVRLKTGISQAPETTVPVYAAVVPKVEAKPQLFSVRPGAKEVERSVRVEWNDNKSHEVEEASVNDPELKVRVETKGNFQNIVLTVPAGYQPSARSRTVTVKTGDAEVPILRVPVRFFGQGRSANVNRARGAVPGAQRKVTAKTPRTARTPKTADAKQAPRKNEDSASTKGDPKRDAGAPSAETTTDKQ
jgi:hypothetical protein